MNNGGARRSENVGTSNHNSGEIPEHRKLKVSLAMFVIQGLGGPKVNPKGVADGQLVNIPAHLLVKLERTKGSSGGLLLDLGWLSKDLSKLNRNFLPREEGFP